MLHGPWSVARRRAAPWHFCRLSTRGGDQYRSLLTLAIETSCDDTCVAILEKPSHLDHLQSTARRARLHFNQKVTTRNSGLGGIHPIEALDSHRTNLANLIALSLAHLPDADVHAGIQDAFQHQDGSWKQKPHFITVTRGPGMRSNLSCGLNTAKGLAVAWQIPLLGAHHMQAHALTPRLVHALGPELPRHQAKDKGNLHQYYERQELSSASLSPDFPFLTLLVSGGHTMLLHSTSLTDHSIMATTLDVAIGDALDKCGRIWLPEEWKVGLADTAFGKYLSQFAFGTPADFACYPIPATRQDEINKPTTKYGWRISNPLSDTRNLAFSFTGLATTAARLHASRMELCGGEISLDERRFMAQTLLGTAFEHLGSRIVIALDHLRKRNVDIPTLVVSGGVAANDFLRHFLRSMLDIRGHKQTALIFPPIELCTDNAAMIAWCGMEMFEAGFRSDLAIGPKRKWSMDPSSPDGGILGVDN